MNATFKINHVWICSCNMLCAVVAMEPEDTLPEDMEVVRPAHSPVMQQVEPPAASKAPPLQDPGNYESGHDVDEDEISHLMTTSYSEISFKSDDVDSGDGTPIDFDLCPFSMYMENLPGQNVRICERAKPLGPLDLEGSVRVEGNMTHFVAEDLEYKIKLSKLQRIKETTQIHVGLLNDVEYEAQRIATSIDSLTENLCGILHSMSSITADNIDVYKNAVSNMSDAMDANIKSMYTIMAKAEEVTQVMKIVQAHSTKLKEIKGLVDLLESFV